MAKAGTKRKASTKVDKLASKSKQSRQDGQKAVSKRDLDIPVDEGFHAAPHISVYIDNDGIIYDAALNQTNIGNNNNKFYRVQLLSGNKGKKQQFFTHTRWGRVGESGSVKTIGPFVNVDQAMTEFNKKFKDKSGYNWKDRNEEPKKGKYAFIEKSYERDDDDDGDVKKEEDDDDNAAGKAEVESKLPIATQRLVELIFNENHFNSVLQNIGYNNDKLPLGKLGKPTLKKGFELLKEIASLIKHPKLAQNKYQLDQREALEDFTNRYYTTIPHAFGRSKPILINNNDLLQKEVAMLDTLSDMEVANNIMKTTNEKARDAESISLLDKRFKQLGMDELTPLDHKSQEYQGLKDYLINTSGHTHGITYRLQDIFRVERSGEGDRWAKSEFANLQDTNRKLLWHGSRTTNYGGILSRGLRIAPPEAPVSGYAFGKGVYLADISTKSANYCMPYLSGGHGLLLLCEVELGRPMYEILDADYNAGEEAAKKGCIATLGVGNTVSQGWVDAGSIHKTLKGVQMPDISKKPDQQKIRPNAYLQYNEYICYNVAQLRLKYLLRVQM